MSETTSTSTVDRPWQSYHTVYTNAKAGMDGVDKEKVQKVVYEMSKGSKYFENEERKEAFIKEKIENMRVQCAKLTEMDISHHQMVADKRMLELEAGRDLIKTWLHVDMDAFYAAVETLANPSLKGKPMAVGSMSMISTANYEARRFGVRAAMPGFIARKLCPELIFVPVDFKKYTHYSDLTRKVFQKYDPNFIACSLDEAYLDITEVCKESGMSSGEIAGKLRTDIYEETGLTCSAGVAPNLLLAKICSDIEKPNGQFVLPNNRMAITTFIASLPIRKIGGIGKVTEHTLRDVLGINTCEELLQKRAFISALFSHSSADFFLSVGLGLGKTDAPQVRLRKSISTERTFSATEDEGNLYHILADIAEMLATDMHKEGLRGRTLTLKLKTASFEVRSRAVSLQKCIYSSDEILNHAKKLLKAELPLSLRLIGLRMSQFNDFILGPVDPLQKTLTNFVIKGETSGKVVRGQSSSGTDIIDNHLISDTEIDHHIDAHKSCLSDSDYTHESGNPMDSNLFHHLECSNQNESNDASEKDRAYPTLSMDSNLFHHLECSNQNESNDASEKDRACPTLTNDCASKVINPDSNGCVTQSHEAGGVQTVETGSCSLSGHFKSEPIGVKKRDNLLDKDAVSSLDHKQLFWVDDYKCSLCGTELPPNFVEERQEHSDYHFAEMLQKEESGQNARENIRPRSTQKAKGAAENKRKKQKTNPKDGKYLPIDVFFVKTNQNF